MTVSPARSRSAQALPSATPKPARFLVASARQTLLKTPMPKDFSREEFASMALEVFAREKPFGAPRFDAASFAIVSLDGGREAYTPLHAIYERCAQGRDHAARRRLLEAHVRALPTATAYEGWPEAAPRLRPVLKLRAAVELGYLQLQLAGTPHPRRVALPVNPHWLLCLAIDTGDALGFVSPELLRAWGRTQDEAFGRAWANLAGGTVTGFQRLGSGLYRASWNDGFDPARLWLSEGVDSLRLPGDPLAFVALDGRTLLCGSEDARAQAEMFSDAATAGPGACAGYGLLRRGGAWTGLVLPGATSPVNGFFTCQLAADEAVYQEQKPLLEALHRDGRGGVFVADFVAFDSPRLQRRSSVCVWSRGVPTSLPKTEHVALTDPRQRKPETRTRLYRWDDLHARAGHLMQPENVFPPRFRVDNFPGRDVLAHLEPVSV